LGNKLFTFLHIEQKAAAGLGYIMAPENALTNCQMLQLMNGISYQSSTEKALASRQTLQIMGADRTIMRRCVSRQGASTRARDCRASALRHTRAPGEAPSYLLDK